MRLALCQRRRGTLTAKVLLELPVCVCVCVCVTICTYQCFSSSEELASAPAVTMTTISPPPPPYVSHTACLCVYVDNTVNTYGELVCSHDTAIETFVHIITSYIVYNDHSSCVYIVLGCQIEDSLIGLACDHESLVSNFHIILGPL